MTGRSQWYYVFDVVRSTQVKGNMYITVTGKKVRAVLSARCIGAVSLNEVLYCDREVRAVLGV